MPEVGFKPTATAFEIEKRVLALDRVATVIGCVYDYDIEEAIKA
jgi:hypothetical protein